MDSRDAGHKQAKIDLNAYRWKNRLLMVFAPSKEDSGYLSLVEEMDDRDLLVFHLVEDQEDRFSDALLDQNIGDELRKRLSIDPGRFTFLLIGKDGGEKLRRTSSVDLSEIFSLIDVMPMRRREMQERRSRNE